MRDGLSTSTEALQTIPSDMPTSQPDVDCPSVKLSSHVILSCVKLTIKTHLTIAPSFTWEVSEKELPRLLLGGAGSTESVSSPHAFETRGKLSAESHCGPRSKRANVLMQESSAPLPFPHTVPLTMMMTWMLTVCKAGSFWAVTALSVDGGEGWARSDKERRKRS